MTPYDSVGYTDLHKVLRYANIRAIEVDERESKAKRERMKQENRKK